MRPCQPWMRWCEHGAPCCSDPAGPSERWPDAAVWAPDSPVQEWISMAIETPWLLWAEDERADLDAQVATPGTRCTDYPPCGGCDSCIAGQIAHGWRTLREEASRYARAGFAWAPWAVGVPYQDRGHSHDGFGHLMAGEKS